MIEHSKYCYHCGRIMLLETVFCEYCGKEFSDSDTDETIDLIDQQDNEEEDEKILLN